MFTELRPFSNEPECLSTPHLPSFGVTEVTPLALLRGFSQPRGNDGLKNENIITPSLSAL